MGLVPTLVCSKPTDHTQPERRSARRRSVLEEANAKVLIIDKVDLLCRSDQDSCLIRQGLCSLRLPPLAG
jgi:hypothetical protein